MLGNILISFFIRWLFLWCVFLSCLCNLFSYLFFEGMRLFLGFEVFSSGFCQFSHSVVSYSLWPHDCSMPGLPVHHQLPGLAKTHVHWVMSSTHLILYRPLLLLPLIFSSISVFSNESVLPIRWPKYWSFRISPANEYSALISFRFGCFDVLTFEGALKSLLQLHSLKASILQHSAIFRKYIILVFLWYLPFMLETSCEFLMFLHVW